MDAATSSPRSKSERDAPEAKPEQPLIFRVSRLPYFALFVGLYPLIAWLMYLVLKEPNFATLSILCGALAAALAWRGLWVTLFTSGYRLWNDRLDIVGAGGKHTLTLSDVAVLTSKLRRKSGSHSIRVATAERDHVIPRYIEGGSSNLFIELGTRVAARQAELHRRDAPPADEYDANGAAVAPRPWIRYPNLPPDLKALMGEVETRGGGAHTLVFGFNKRKRPAIGQPFFQQFLIWLFVLGIVCNALQLGVHGNSQKMDDLAAGFVLSGLAAFVFLLTVLVNPVKTKREWFVLHPFGLAMLGDHLTGELTWHRIATIDPAAPWSKRGTASMAPPTPTGDFFCIETEDKASIVVADVYDAPICLIADCCVSYRSQYGGNASPA